MVWIGNVCEDRLIAASCKIEEKNTWLMSLNVTNLIYQFISDFSMTMLSQWTNTVWCLQQAAGLINNQIRNTNTKTNINTKTKKQIQISAASFSLV